MSGVLDRRMGWIEASLRYAGVFGSAEKKAYMHAFSITSGMVSRDQVAFLNHLREKGPGEPVHFHKGKLMVGANSYQDGAWPAFLPDDHLFDVTPLQSWLRDTLCSRFEVCRAGGRSDPTPEIMRLVLAAIQAKKAIDIEYFSRTGGHTRRVVSPHTIVDVANRLHVRAFDHGKGRFADFVLSRIIGGTPMKPGEARYVGIDKDVLWGRTDRVILKPRDGVDPAAARLDYGLDGSGYRIEKVRSALTPYIVDIADEAFEAPVTVSLLGAESDTP